MSLTVHTIDSRILGKRMRLAVYCPDRAGSGALPVLYYLHGRTGDERLLSQLGIGRKADAMIQKGEIRPLIIVCPCLENSRGINSAEVFTEVPGRYGPVQKGPYEEYLLKEVIPYVERTCPAGRDRRDRYIGGVSSGGYTALSIGLRHQDLFSRIGGHMPAIDLSYEEEDECYFADEAMWKRNDPVAIAENSVFSDLRVFLDDGSEDEGQFWRACRKLYAVLKERGADVSFSLFPGHHDAAYILSNLETCLRFYGGPYSPDRDKAADPDQEE